MNRVLFAILLIVATLFSFVPSVLAIDLVDGSQVFGVHCASCHMNGRNMVNPAKTLQKADLEKYEMVSIEAIQNQIRNGKNAMPAFKERLNDTQIENVAAYVLEQAGQGWKP